MPRDPYGPIHGGNYDPNEHINRSEITGPIHGGNYDPNQFDANRAPGQNRGQQPNSMAMALDAAQGASSDPNSEHNSDQFTNSSNPAGARLDPSSMPMETLERGYGHNSPQAHSSEGSQARMDSSFVHNPADGRASSSANSPLIDPVDFSGDAELDERRDRVLRKPRKTFYHRDILKRPYRGIRDDRFLNPKDGRPSELIVQCSQEVLNTTSAVSWTRTRVRNKSPWLFRLSSWASGGDAMLRWLPACLLLGIVLCNPLPVTTKTRNNGFFEPFPYKDWQYPYDARNKFENSPSKGRGDRKRAAAMSETAPSGQSLIGKIERISEPEYLCLAEGMEIIKVENWREKHGKNAKLEYVMVSYTSAQFPSDEDRRYLHELGQHAAQAAGVEAYWLGCSCLGDTTKEVEQNVWRICDVIRGAFSVVIAVAGPANLAGEEGGLPYDLLREWGRRVWTLPELLLSPEKSDIVVYQGRSLGSTPHQISRRNFPRFWDDSTLVGQLIDHCEGSPILSPLELMTTALLCLQNRHTTEYLPGDLSYALMGLLRQRPHVCPTDSAFQAFARLSLANDSNMLLERLVCLLPRSAYEPWHSFEDYWGASLWDINPKTQVCAIGENDTVILDGVRAASIRWKSFAPVMLRGHDTIKRKFVRIVISIVVPFLLVGLIIIIVTSLIITTVPNMTVTSSIITTGPNTSQGFQIFGGILVAFAALTVLLSPKLIQSLYFGKVWSAQPWFFGMEGYMPLPDLERHLFGANLGRLSWSTTGSSLSRHEVEDAQDYDNFCQGQDPSTYPDIHTRIKQAAHSSDGAEKIFMLVDTYTLTVTMFSAVKPPVAVLLCGEEGGMQRALLCSYEWTNNTLYRETVLRMETRVYWRMAPVGRVRIGLGTRRYLDV